MAMSKEQLHRLIDCLPPEKLPALADVLDKLIEEDDELVTDEEIARYRDIRNKMKHGDFVRFNEAFGDKDV